ncbi:MAG: hypothetical protein KatS3mg004_0293 [Bryobacteraceae bacterium]|nr:MAG: hypothetical protein KatS3mg004_0293 [Bryobacteraceae bacterium]
MRAPAIRVENLGKMYRIGGPVERYRTFRDTVAQSVAGLGRRVRSWFGGENGAAPKYETIWALKDVSFEVQPGEVVGIIGRNGAGKSTLLKILSRITEPTTGRVEIRGRVGSLLEVGTGFHPELTGRENVYLNGAILGMKRAEVDQKFDEIVAFAEIEKFIDTPVKHYSSGMYVRLAFSVAAHLDTDILLVDEVLSVGDAGFQRKCLTKMGGVTTAGKTVLFVSHNLTAIRSLCNRVLYLSSGKIVADGAANSVVNEYLRASEGCEEDSDLTKKPYLCTSSSAKGPFLKTAWFAIEEGKPVLTVADSVQGIFIVDRNGYKGKLALGWYLLARDEQIVFNSVSGFTEVSGPQVVFRCNVPGRLLNDESYTVRVQVIEENWRVVDDVRHVGILRVADGERPSGYMGKWGGVVRPALKWSVSSTDGEARPDVG